MVWPALIAAGGALLGGALNRKSQKKQNAITRAREDSAIQRRVSDSKASGIHPIYGVGGQGASSAALPAGDYSETSTAASNVGNAMSATRINEVSIEEAKSRTRLNNAQSSQIAANSLMARTSQKSNSQQDLGLTDVGTQRTVGLSLDADIQNFEDKYGDAASIMVVPKLAHERLGKTYPTKWLNKQIDAQKRRKFPRVNYTYKNGRKIYDRSK